MMGLKHPCINNQLANTQISSYLPRTVNSLDILLEYKSYIAAVGEHNVYDRFNMEKNSRMSGRNKPIDDMDDKRNKSIQYEKDAHDLFLEKLVKNTKQQRRVGKLQYLLYVVVRIPNKLELTTKYSFKSLIFQN